MSLACGGEEKSPPIKTILHKKASIRSHLSLLPVFLPVLLGGVVGGEGSVVGLVEQEVLQLLVVVQGALQLLQLGRVGGGVLVVPLLESGDLGLGLVPLIKRKDGHLRDVSYDALVGNTKN